MISTPEAYERTVAQADELHHRLHDFDIAEDSIQGILFDFMVAAQANHMHRALLEITELVGGGEQPRKEDGEIDLDKVGMYDPAAVVEKVRELVEFKKIVDTTGASTVGDL
jgi:hypothetical protein